jgi:hypothetical protein
MEPRIRTSSLTTKVDRMAAMGSGLKSLNSPPSELMVVERRRMEKGGQEVHEFNVIRRDSENLPEIASNAGLLCPCLKYLFFRTV